jgi:hypothetical protein
MSVVRFAHRRLFGDALLGRLSGGTSSGQCPWFASLTVAFSATPS